MLFWFWGFQVPDPPPWGCLPSSKKTGHHHLANLVSFPLGRGSLGLTSTGINLTPIHPPWACNFSTDFLEGRGVTHTLAKNQSVASQGGGQSATLGIKGKFMCILFTYIHTCVKKMAMAKNTSVPLAPGHLNGFLPTDGGGGVGSDTSRSL